MRTVVGSTIIAVLLAAAGGVCWAVGQTERELALAAEQLAMMRYDVAAETGSLEPTLKYATPLPLVGARFVADARDRQATAQYWLGRYDALTGPRDAVGAASTRDPLQLLLASNASFRATQAETVDRATAISHIEAVIKNYAEALKANPGNEDAAYNYEFAVHTRDTLARARGAAAAPKISGADGTPTIHGRPGAPPKGVSMGNFKVMVPKQSDERKGGDEAGKGGVKVRKG